MKAGLPLVLIAALQAMPAFARDPVETALAGVLVGCETWVTEPASWTDGPEPFLAAMDLGGRVSSVETIPEDFQPPPDLRRSNRFWRIDATDRAGFALTVSEELPMCHIVGLGFADFQAAVDWVVRSPAFTASWEQYDELEEETGRSLFFRHRTDTAFALTLSQPSRAPERPGGIQLLATAVYSSP